MKSIRTSFITILLLFAIVSLRAQFSHPGILHTLPELDFAISKVAANQQPWKKAYDNLIASPYAQLGYTYQAFDYVNCGSFNNPNVGCNEMVEDGMAAYSLALRWYFTKNAAYANKSIQIINAWSNKYVENPLQYSNSRLVVSWATPWFVNAAEILRYTGTGWSVADVTKFNSMLDKFLPYTLDETMPGNNWIQSAIEAHMAIAIFKNNTTSFNAAVNRWKARCKTYLYQTTDGAVPVIIPGKTQTQTINIWKDGSTNLTFINGLGMETCRDLGHLKLGFHSMIYAAEAAWHQGVDLFSLEKKRLSDFMELHGSWMTGAVAVPNSICDGTVKASLADATGIKPPTGGGKAVWEIAYNHLHDRLGMNLPYTLQMLQSIRPANIGKWVFKWETLTHAGRTFTPLPVHLILFEASNTNRSVMVSWSTLSEENNHYFILEKSYDGSSFFSIATVAGAGTSSALHQYQVEDLQKKVSNCYYRLIQVDGNGTRHQSETIAVKLVHEFYVQVQPNPFENTLQLNVATEKQFQYVITDLNGKLFESGNSSESAIEIGLLLKPGIYNLHVRTEENYLNIKIVKL
jgi:hypothetical protein